MISKYKQVSGTEKQECQIGSSDILTLPSLLTRSLMERMIMSLRARVLPNATVFCLIQAHKSLQVCGQSDKHFTLVNYDSTVVPDWKIPLITTLES